MLNRLALSLWVLWSWPSGIMSCEGGGWFVVATLAMAIWSFGDGIQSSMLSEFVCGPVVGNRLSATGAMWSLPGLWTIILS
jgi:hypothetical protein